MQALDDGEWSIRLEDREIHSSCFFSLGRRHCNVTEIQAVISEVILGRYLRFRENLKKKKSGTAAGHNWSCIEVGMASAGETGCKYMKAEITFQAERYSFSKE